MPQGYEPCEVLLLHPATRYYNEKRSEHKLEIFEFAEYFFIERERFFDVRTLRLNASVNDAVPILVRLPRVIERNKIALFNILEAVSERLPAKTHSFHDLFKDHIRLDDRNLPIRGIV